MLVMLGNHKTMNINDELINPTVTVSRFEIEPCYELIDEDRKVLEAMMKNERNYIYKDMPHSVEGYGFVNDVPVNWTVAITDNYNEAKAILKSICGNCNH